MKTIPKLVPATVMARESYLLSLAIVGYYSWLFPADKYLCLKALLFPPKGFFNLLWTSLREMDENLEKSRRRQFL